MNRTISIIFASLVFTFFSLAQPFARTVKSGQTQTGTSAQAGEDYERLKQMVGKIVKDSQGQNLGKIQDVVIMNGKAEFVIISPQTGGDEQKMIPIPWHVAKVKAQNGQVTAQLTREQLQNAPSFTQNQWPNFSESSYDQKIRSYYRQGGQQERMKDQGSQGMQKDRQGN